MHPNGLFVLTVGLCSFFVVCVAAGFLLVKAWRLFKNVIRVSRAGGPVAADLALRAEQLGRLGDDMAHQTEQIVANVERLSASTRRLQVVAEAWVDATTPYRAVRDYLGR